MFSQNQSVTTEKVTRIYFQHTSCIHTTEV